MGYIQEFEAELASKLKAETDTEALVRWVSGKVLESYRNGQVARKNGGRATPAPGPKEA